MPKLPAYAANYIPGLQREGFGASEALQFLRDVGYGVRRQNFLHEWGAQLHEDSNRPQLFQAALDRAPHTREITQRQSPKARGFQYQIEHLLKDNETGELYFTPGAHRALDAVTYGEAIAGAEEAWLAGQASDERYPQGELLGSVVTAVREYVPIDEGE